jgi:hypothetical protein
MRRLASVSPLRWNVENFYPRIAEAGGTERAGFGLPMLFELVIADACDSALVAQTLRIQTPNYLRAIVDDPEVLEDALSVFREINPGLEGT